MLKIQKGDFNPWLTHRILKASTGSILDFDRDEYVDVATAPGRVFLEHTERKGAIHKKDHAPTVEAKALDQARSDKSDPFAYSRTKLHLQNGLCDLDDYSVDWQKVTTDVLDFADKVVGRTMRDMAMRVRRA